MVFSWTRAAAGTLRPNTFSVPRIADQRLFLASQQDEDGTDDCEDQGDRLIEKIGLDHALPGPIPEQPLDGGLQGGQRVLVDVGPGRADAAEIQTLIRDCFGTVMDEEDEAQGEHQQTDEAKNETDHDLAVTRNGTTRCRPPLSLTSRAVLVQLSMIRTTCRCGRNVVALCRGASLRRQPAAP